MCASDQYRGRDRERFKERSIRPRTNASTDGCSLEQETFNRGRAQTETRGTQRLERRTQAQSRADRSSQSIQNQHSKQRSQRRKTVSAVGSERAYQPRSRSSLNKPTGINMKVRSSRKTPVFSQRDSLQRKIIIGAAILLVLLILFMLGKCATSCSKPDNQSTLVEQATSAPAPQPAQHMTYTTAYAVIDTQTYDYERAKAGGSEDPQMELQEVLKNASQYPASLIDNMSLNPEMLHFVYDYPTKKSEPSPDTIGKTIKVSNRIPLILQFDERWGYQVYGGEHILAVSGCGPTCISMVASGLTGDTSITPLKVAQYAEKNNLYTPGSGTSWDLMSDGCKQFGIVGSQMKSVTESRIKKELEQGHPIIASMAPGDFTILGHYIILTGMTPDGNLEINDPNSRVKSASLWPIDRVLPQIKTAWVMKKK